MRIIASITVLAAALLAAPFAPSARAADALLTIGAAPLGGTYYPAAIALADIIRKYVPGVEARVEVTGGTMENPVLMQQGELEIGLANADVAFFAFQGEAPFPARLGDIRTMFSGLAPGVVQYAVRAESGIRSVRDLAGKRVAVGPQGNSSSLLFGKVLEFYGIPLASVSRSFVSFSDGVGELLDGHVDMAIVQAGLPAPGLQEAFASGRAIHLISFPPEERAAFLGRHPYYIPVTIPAGTYAGDTGETTTVATQNLVLAHASLPEETVYRITKAVFAHLPELYAAHPSLRSLTHETAIATSIPLHAGATRYFREAGALPGK